MFNRPRGPRAPHRYPSLLSPQTGGNPVPRVARLAIQLAEARKLDYLDDTVLRFLNILVEGVARSAFMSGGAPVRS